MEWSYAGRLNVSIMPRVHQGMEKTGLQHGIAETIKTVCCGRNTYRLPIEYLPTCVYIRKY